jgi:putative transposase
MAVNHKWIARIMQQDNLLAVRLEWFRPGQQHVRAARIYLNLANRMTLSGLNQLWAADITYIRLACEFVYLAVVLDVFSRKVIGWALGRSLKAQLLCALWSEQSLIEGRRPESCTIQIRVCNTLVRNTWKNSAIIRCCQA